ncbi:MAG: hypothetical protein PQJ61_14165 [Spirochaetales bacterium]|uniref:GIY-YIG domain-containing protein n=1 Tax=Candidatus Thalassospirochaeta sargassi TaxID=3119039 RepID=A0AAJ1IH94_9SPIO|nr:hypothetical protein [Spirochaetales bacterium]
MKQNEIPGFPPEVIDKLKYYVYRLIDPRNGETFYVGKGRGNRVFQHMRGALGDEESDELSDKLQIIREILSAGLDVIHVIHRHGMDEKMAFEVEAALIDAYPGISNIAGGTGSNDFGPMNALEIIDRYAAEEAVFCHKCLMITVNRSFSERGIYDATRFAWKISKTKVKSVELVLSVIQGMIVEVFKPAVWLDATKDNFPEIQINSPGRIGFTGEVAEDAIRDLYIRKRIPDSYRKRGAVNPVKYSF